MSRKIFVNLPVKDLNKSVEFFSKLNFKFNPQFTDENATCMIVSEDIYVMLLVEKYFKTFTLKETSNAHQNAEVIVALTLENRQEVDEMFDKALRAGAKMHKEPQSEDVMYVCAFEDLDGHLWELFYMDVPDTDSM